MNLYKRVFLGLNFPDNVDNKKYIFKDQLFDVMKNID